ncbi:hypothetical protein Pan5_26 [Pseudanabaena phage Pan5]|nr:hypothetical protein Pan5_26 [Pseudanabaena phage Pan5]
MHWLEEKKERIRIMELELQKAKQITGYMASKGWRKEIGSPRFEKGNKSARVDYPFLIIDFTNMARLSFIVSHRIRIF